MTSLKTDEVDGYGLVFSLYETENLPLEASVRRIKEAECHASDDGLCWVLLAQTWLALSKRFNLGVEDVKQCLLIAEPLPNFIDGLITGLELWFELAKDNPSEYSMARRWMGVMEKDLSSDPNPADACTCARAWARFPDAEDRRNAWRLLDYANELYAKEALKTSSGSHLIRQEDLLSEFRQAMIDARIYCIDHVLKYPWE